ncbi:MAG: general stress protein [Beijerinckiaceae bacterium]
MTWNDKLKSPSEFNTLCFVPHGLESRDVKDRGQAPPFLKENKMEKAKVDSVIAVFADHPAAEAAVKKLLAAGFETKNLSVVGKGYHTDEKVAGFYNIGDRVKFWGTRGAFWGGFWGLFLGGLFVTVPAVGHVVVLGYLATVAITAIENAVVVGGLSALGAALYSMGIPKDSVIQYETAVKADSFLVMAQGTAEEIARAKTILSTANPSRLDVHAGANAAEPAGRFGHAGG